MRPPAIDSQHLESYGCKIRNLSDHGACSFLLGQEPASQDVVASRHRSHVRRAWARNFNGRLNRETCRRLAQSPNSWPPTHCDDNQSNLAFAPRVTDTMALWYVHCGIGFVSS